jgi:DNA-binding Lrp family transcriptional regulator
MTKLDLKDRKILYELDLNARQSDAEIGRKVGLSKGIVNYRIKKLIDEEVLKYFYTMIDASKLGYLSCRFFMKFQYDDPKKEKEIIDYFVSQPYSWWVPSIEGQLDLAVILWARNTYEFYELIKDVLGKFKPFIKDFLPGIYAKFHQYRRDYLIKDNKIKSEPVLTCFAEQVDFDKTDINILKTIAENARKPTIEIANTLNLTSETVKLRIKRLIDKNVIQGFRAALNLNKLGYRWYKLRVDLEDFSRNYEILSYAKNHPNIVYAYEVVGGANLELELEVESYDHFKDICLELRNKFSDVIRYYDHFLFYKEHKILYMPMTI